MEFGRTEGAKGYTSSVHPFLSCHGLVSDLSVPSSDSELRWTRFDLAESTLILWLGSGLPSLVYWGPRLTEDLDDESLDGLRQRPVPHGALDQEEPLTWLPEAATGFSGRPGLVLRRRGAEQLTQLGVDADGGVSIDASGLRVVCVDRLAAVAVTVRLEVDERSGVLSSSCSVRNEGDEPLGVDWLAAATLGDLPGLDELGLFEGRWCYEAGMTRCRLATGSLSKENRVGRTSHHSYPALVCGEPGFSHQRGAVLGLHLGWSGNHRVFAERLRDGRMQAQLGELLAPGEIVLEPGESYSTPTLHACYSAGGTNGLSASFHDFVRRKVLPPKRGAARPVHFNTWETLYFDHSEERTLALVGEAAAMGAERFVLDDGWFTGRTSDRAGLGDWEVCRERYPNGLEPVVKAVRAAGMRFGLWIEPEMVNEDSNLFREHPDWALGVAGRQQPLGRGQYALNLCREDVFEHLREVIVGLVMRYDIDYLKWDMNRDLCHVVHEGRPASHRMTEATYRLFDAVRAACPGLEIESCSSGGARADYGILRRADRIWASDNHDPRDRQLIQQGFNLFLPPEVVGSHIGSERSEVTGRSQSMAYRAGTALFGHFGIEAASSELGDDPHGLLRWTLDTYRRQRDWMHRGRTLYLDAFDPEIVARLCLAADGARGLLSVARLDAGRFAVLSPLRVAGLDARATYEVRLLHPDTHTFMKTGTPFHRGEPLTVSGELLTRVGLQLPVMQPQSIVLVELVRRGA